MPPLGSEIDAMFFEMIHGVCAADVAWAEEERRRISREHYRTVQKIAPYDGVRLPEASEFSDVCCHDLSRTGVSFLLDRRPWFSSLVFAFGESSQKVYIEGKVVRVTRALAYPDGEVMVISDESLQIGFDNTDRSATPMLVVACQFVQRLNAPEPRWLA